MSGHARFRNLRAMYLSVPQTWRRWEGCSFLNWLFLCSSRAWMMAQLGAMFLFPILGCLNFEGKGLEYLMPSRLAIAIVSDRLVFETPITWSWVIIAEKAHFCLIGKAEQHFHRLPLKQLLNSFTYPVWWSDPGGVISCKREIPCQIISRRMTLPATNQSPVDLERVIIYSNSIECKKRICRCKIEIGRLMPRRWSYKWS
jgi:hypothetical protein